MSSARARKHEVVDSINSMISSFAGEYSTVALISFSGMSMNDMNQLRVLASKNKTRVMVAKRRLISRALQSDDATASLKEFPKGHSALVCSNGLDAAVTLGKFKPKDKITLLGAVVQNQLMSQKSLIALSKYESIDHIYAHILRLIRTPWVKVVRVAKTITSQD